MEVDVRVEVIAAEGVDQHREALRDVAVAEVLAHDGTVLGLDLSVIVCFEEANSERHSYTVIASNMSDSWSAEDIYVWYCQRGQSSENGIKELKNGFGMRRMPCGQMSANAMYFATGVLAHNLFVLFKVVALDESWQRHQVQTLRWRLFHQAGKVVHTGRRWVLKVAKDALGLFDPSLTLASDTLAGKARGTRVCGQ
ncbi:MAG: transposase [Betaproteobacteria bacterium]|nr:transposase [Betaproteobacteria bacterium]